MRRTVRTELEQDSAELNKSHSKSVSTLMIAWQKLVDREQHMRERLLLPDLNRLRELDPVRIQTHPYRQPSRRFSFPSKSIQGTASSTPPNRFDDSIRLDSRSADP